MDNLGALYAVGGSTTANNNNFAAGASTAMTSQGYAGGMGAGVGMGVRWGGGVGVGAGGNGVGGGVEGAFAGGGAGMGGAGVQIQGAIGGGGSAAGGGGGVQVFWQLYRSWFEGCLSFDMRVQSGRLFFFCFFCFVIWAVCLWFEFLKVVDSFAQLFLIKIIIESFVAAAGWLGRGEPALFSCVSGNALDSVALRFCAQVLVSNPLSFPDPPSYIPRPPQGPQLKSVCVGESCPYCCGTAGCIIRLRGNELYVSVMPFVVVMYLYVPASTML